MASKIMFSSNLTVPIKDYCCNNTLTSTVSSSFGVKGRMFSSSSSSSSFNSSSTTDGNLKRFLQLIPIRVASPSISMLDFVNVDIQEEEKEKKKEVMVRESEDKLAAVWREIQGINGWDDLLVPLDPLLLTEIVRYGELVNACYKAFDLDPKSKRFLNCKYGKKMILKDVGLTPRDLNNYDVTKYIYATSPNNNSRWIGYVAVSSDSALRQLGRRDILVSFRGTVTNAEWYANLMSSLTPARFDPHDSRPDVMVQSGFLSIYTSADTQTSRFGHRSCREQLLCEIARLINLYKDEGEEISITLAGHSMGSSLAILLGYDLAELGLNVVNGNTREEMMKKKKIPITVYSFAGPRVGNLEFKNRCDELGVKVLRVVNVNDPITKLPGVFLNDENFRLFGFEFDLPWRSSSHCYTHVGVELSLDFFKVSDPSCVHDLQHLINGLMMKNIINGEEDGEGEEEWKQWIDQMMMDHQVLSMAYQFSCLWQDAAANICNMIQSLGL